MNIFPENADLTPSKNVKFGIDPTSNRLHLGHFIPLRFVKKMKEQGHKVTIVLGTCTAQLGDPSGRDATRPILSEKAVLNNAADIKMIVQMILGNDTKFFFNNDFHKEVTLVNFIHNVASQFTLGHMTSRNAFADRIANDKPIAMHELIVPMLQGMDSVHLKTEIEVGGQDQLFNFQIARQLQISHGQKPQSCVMFPVINGTDGRKMSKSFHNCIFLDENPIDIFMKVMSISDVVMEQWFPLLTDKKPVDHPMESKKVLGFDIVQQLWGTEAAQLSQEAFEKKVQKKEQPVDIPLIKATILQEVIQQVRKCSASEAKRLIEGKGVKVDGVVAGDIKMSLKSEQIVQIGKREFVKVKL